jgi:hypothetical protein
MFGWFSNTPRSIYQKMGFYSDQSGIIRRYKREVEFWEEHLKKTKESILICSGNKNKNKIAILGSGWLLDIPMEEISQLFSEIWLFDICHPKVIKELYNGENIHFIETDLSGFALPVYKMCKSARKITPEIVNALTPEFSYNFQSFDYVVSCNILDQLDDLLIEYIRRNSIISKEIEKSLRIKLQEIHISSLPDNKSLIITDVQELIVDANNSIISEKQLIYSKMKNRKSKMEWIWKFDNLRMYSNVGNTWFKVNVFEK